MANRHTYKAKHSHNKRKYKCNFFKYSSKNQKRQNIAFQHFQENKTKFIQNLYFFSKFV